MKVFGWQCADRPTAAARLRPARGRRCHRRPGTPLGGRPSLPVPVTILRSRTAEAVAVPARVVRASRHRGTSPPPRPPPTSWSTQVAGRYRPPSRVGGRGTLVAQAGRDRGVAGVRRQRTQQRRPVAAWSVQGRKRQHCYAVPGRALGPSAAQRGKRRVRPARYAAARMQRRSRCASRGRQGPGPLAATPTGRAAGWEATPTTGPSPERRATGDLPQPPTSPTSHHDDGTETPSWPHAIGIVPASRSATGVVGASRCSG